MSLSFYEVPPRTATTLLQQRVDRLRASMEWAADAIDSVVRDEVMSTIARCDERLALGVEHTVVALAGGTGSGKSSLFNAIVGRDFAQVGVARPTTSDPVAVTWGEADALLDWLGIGAAQRLLLPAQPEPDGVMLDGVVLVDLPDHDSVNTSNRDTVDRVVPLADLIVWVVDPQKYADHALHSAYVKVASDHGQPSLVVLNHADRLAAHDVDVVLGDLERLVAGEGITGAPVLVTSARDGRGVAALRAEIAAAASTRTVAAEAVRADLIAAGRALERALARDADPVLPDVEGLIAAFARAAGVEARADAAAAAASGRQGAVEAPLGASLAAVEQVRLEWVDAATAGLPLAWRLVVDEAILPAAALGAEIDSALAAGQWPELDTGASGSTRRRGSVVPGARSRRARQAAQAVRRRGRDAIRAVVYPQVVEPTEMIHQAYRNLDELTELD